MAAPSVRLKPSDPARAGIFPPGNYEKDASEREQSRSAFELKRLRPDTKLLSRAWCSSRVEEMHEKGCGRTFWRNSSDLLVSPKVKSLETSTLRPAYEATASAFLVLNEYWEGV